MATPTANHIAAAEIAISAGRPKAPPKPIFVLPEGFRERFLRLDPDVVAITNIDPKELRRMIRRGDFHPGYDAGGRSTRWKLSETLRWQATRPVAPTPPPPTHHIYFIQATSGPIKIGTTKKVAERLATLQVYAWEPLSLLAVMPGTPEGERQLHKVFAADRLQGEWFRPSPDLLAYIRTLQGAADRK